jgi:hypothetical protein
MKLQRWLPSQLPALERNALTMDVLWLFSYYNQPRVMPQPPSSASIHTFDISQILSSQVRKPAICPFDESGASRERPGQEREWDERGRCS